MPWLSVAHREIRTASRSLRLRRARFAAGTLAVLLCAWLLLVLGRGGVTGRDMFEILTAVAFGYCLLAGVAHTADCLSEEKRDHTLGLLFLTPLRGYDVVLGKLLAHSLTSFFGLLAMLPVLAAPLVMGGVLFTDFWCVSLNLINTLFFSLAVGLFISGVSHRQWTALILALSAVFLFAFGGYAGSLLLKDYYQLPQWARVVGFISPLQAHLHAFANAAWRRPADFWWTLLFTHGVAWFLLGTTSWVLPRTWQERSGRAWRHQWRQWWLGCRFGSTAGRRMLRRRQLARNAFSWLAAREPVSSLGYLGLACAVVTMAIWLGPRIGKMMGGPGEPMAGYLFTWFWVGFGLHVCLLFKVANDASRRLGEDRESGALELLLVTPLSVRRIVAGQWRALGRQLTGPAILVGLVHGFFLWGMVTFYNVIEGTKLTVSQIVSHVVMHGFTPMPGLELAIAWLVLMVLSAGLLVMAHWMALGWVGMWLGLRLRRARFAPWLALGLVGLPPWIVFSIVMVVVGELQLPWPEWGVLAFGLKLALGLGLLHDVILSLWAARHLRRDFRSAATARFQTARPHRRWHRLKRASLGAAGVGLLVIVFYTVEGWRGERAWNRLQRELAVKGEKIDLASITPPPVAAERNFAAAPMLAPLFDYDQTPQGPRWKNPDAYHQLESLTVDGQNGLAQVSGNLLQLGWPTQQWTDLQAWKKFYQGRSGFPKVDAAPDAATAVLLALSLFEDELRELRAASQRPESRFPIHYEAGGAAMLPHLPVLQHLCEVLRLRAVAALAAGQSDAALPDVTLAFYLAGSIRREPYIQSHLGRHAMLNATLQPVWEGLARRRWSAAQLLAIEQTLRQTDLLAEYAGAVHGQCVIEVDWWQAMRDEMSGASRAGINANTHRSEMFRWLYPKGWVRQNQVALYRFCHAALVPVVDAAQARMWMAQAKEAFTAVTQKAFFLQWRNGHLFSHYGREVPWMQTAVNQALLACALERFRLAEGRFPATLAALQPRFLDRIPRDVINGQPLHYRLTADGQFELYSIGWDETDNGGHGPEDWVWRYPDK